MPTIVSAPGGPVPVPPAAGDARAAAGQGAPTFSDSLQAALASTTAAPTGRAGSQAADAGDHGQGRGDVQADARAGAKGHPGRAASGKTGGKGDPPGGSLVSLLAGLAAAPTPGAPGAGTAGPVAPWVAAGATGPQGAGTVPDVVGVAAGTAGPAGQATTGASAPVPTTGAATTGAATTGAATGAGIRASAATSAGGSPVAGVASPSGAPAQATQATVVSSTISAPVARNRPLAGSQRSQAVQVAGAASSRDGARASDVASPGPGPATQPPGVARAQLASDGRVQARGVNQTSPGQVTTPATTATGPQARASQAVTRPQVVSRSDGTPLPGVQTGAPGTAAASVGTPGDAGALTSNLSPAARKVIEAVNQARDATPPNSVVVELPGMDGVRLRVSVDGTTVHLALLGESPESGISGLIRDVATGLGSSGLQLGQDGTGQQGDPGQARRQDPAPRSTVPPPTGRIRTADSGLRI